MAEFVGLEDLEHFTDLVLGELEKGDRNLINEDRFAASYSFHKLKNYSSTLLQLMGSTDDEEINEQLERLLNFVNKFMEENEELEDVVNEPAPVFRVSCNTAASSSVGGRPAIILDAPLISSYRKAGMNWSLIAKILGISRRTLYRNQDKVDLQESVSDNELVGIIRFLKEENPRCGQRYALGYLKAIGKTISRRRVRESLKFVDPFGTVLRLRPKIVRRKFVVKGPNYLWSLDGNEKLQLFKIYIHGLEDTYSRKILYLRCASNKKAHTVLHMFKNAVQDFGFPRMTRSDKGKETIKIAEFVLKHRGIESRAYITGRSVHNIRIERFWGEVNKITLRYKRKLENLHDRGIINLNNKDHIQAIHYVYLPLIQKSLNIFSVIWNYHKLSSARNKSPQELYMTGPHPENVPLLDVASDDSSESDIESDSTESDTESDDEDSFETFARNIVPHPSFDDGSLGENNLKALLNNL